MSGMYHHLCQHGNINVALQEPKQPCSKLYTTHHLQVLSAEQLCMGWRSLRGLLTETRGFLGYEKLKNIT